MRRQGIGLGWCEVWNAARGKRGQAMGAGKAATGGGGRCPAGKDGTGKN